MAFDWSMFSLKQEFGEFTVFPELWPRREAGETVSNSGAKHREATSPAGRPFSTAQPGESVASAGDLALILISARLLFANGQTTERTGAAVEQLAEALGFRATVFPRWGELTVRIDNPTGSRYEIIAVEPLGVDMSKVAATVSVIDQVCDGRMDAEAARSALEAVTRSPPVSVARFALLQQRVIVRSASSRRPHCLKLSGHCGLPLSLAD